MVCTNLNRFHSEKPDKLELGKYHTDKPTIPKQYRNLDDSPIKKFQLRRQIQVQIPSKKEIRIKVNNKEPNSDCLNKSMAKQIFPSYNGSTKNLLSLPPLSSGLKDNSSPFTAKKNLRPNVSTVDSSKMIPSIGSQTKIRNKKPRVASIQNFVKSTNNLSNAQNNDFLDHSYKRPSHRKQDEFYTNFYTSLKEAN